MPASLFSSLLHIIFPSRCPGCGRLAVIYCPSCLETAASAPLPPFCAECGGAYGVPCCHDSAPCFAAAAHDDAARRFILALKYENMRGLGAVMGRRMAALFERVEADMLIPLPLHRGSRRAYNQTELLARGVGESWAIPVEAEALKWKAERKPQTSKKAFERKSLSFDSFEASRIVSGRRVILVDDVYTTGGTVRAAKFALQRAGAEVAAVLVWTRRIRGAEHPAGWPDEALIEP